AAAARDRAHRICAGLRSHCLYRGRACQPDEQFVRDRLAREAARPARSRRAASRGRADDRDRHRHPAVAAPFGPLRARDAALRRPDPDRRLTRSPRRITMLAFPKLQAEPPAPEVAAACAEILKEGYVILRGAVDPALIAAIDGDFAAPFAETPFSQGAFFGSH